MKNMTKINKISLAILIAIGVQYFIVGAFTFNTIDFSMVPSKNGHLSWKWLDLNIYIIFIWYAFLSIRWIIDRMYLVLTIITALLIITLVLYKDTNTFGSMWCWTANIMSFYLIFAVFYKNICV